MMISTRGRYALRVMIDLAENEKDGRYIPMKEVAERQSLSLKYLERIVPLLTKGGMGLDYHLRQEQTLFNIRYGEYDFVILPAEKKKVSCFLFNYVFSSVLGVMF